MRLGCGKIHELDFVFENDRRFPIFQSFLQSLPNDEGKSFCEGTVRIHRLSGEEAAHITAEFVHGFRGRVEGPDADGAGGFRGGEAGAVGAERHVPDPITVRRESSGQ
jgi:hypothetical protein